ncbi:hypothetical protein RvY_12081 [Ramazzottius varieornatus]|uniref:CUB domain-containing protein n=1 Tax=Ramazzottius varieornatus TaxID=947166 RepID=A0A1D1VI71_RAMVA|nr:hypothetical protein RvY_12081 [Ramazzottius varieornatus]
MEFSYSVHFLLLSALAFIQPTVEGVRPVYYNLGDDCAERRIVLPCQTGVAGRVGTMEFNKRPSDTSCQVKIVLDSASCESFGHSFIYFNVKSVDLLEDEVVDFHEHHRYHPNSSNIAPLDSILWVKTLSNNTTCNEGLPSSCEQVLTNDFSLNAEMRVTALTITYRTNSTSRVNSVRPLVMDFVVLTGSENGDDLWCPTLNGFVPRRQMCDASEDSDRVVCPSHQLNETFPEIDNVTMSNTRVVSTLQGSQWNPECRLISIELLIGIVFMFIAAVVLVVIFLIIAQYYRKIWESKKLVYSSGRISFGNSSATSSTVAFENQGYAPDYTGGAFHDTMQPADHESIAATTTIQPLPSSTSQSTMNIQTVARSPAGSLFSISDETWLNTTEA